jgi:hypothetical protein
MNEIIVLELNEVNPGILKRMTEMNLLPNFSKLMKTHSIVNTIATETYEKLEPWIQWVTVHTGKPQSEHGAFNLSDGQHSSVTQIWDVLEQQNIACGVVSAMNARRGAIKKGFFIPDPWSIADDSFPESANSIYKFLAQRVQSHNTSLDEGMSKVSFAMDLLRLGVSPLVVLRLGMAYLNAKLNRRNKWKLAAALDRFLFSLTLRLKRQRRTQYTSVFLNSVAHYQHHYWTRHDIEHWRPRYPALFKRNNPIDASNLSIGDDPVSYGMRSFDRIVGEAMKHYAPESILILTGLSQVPFEGYEDGRGFYLYRPYDHSKLFDALGIKRQRVAPLMSRDVMLYFDDLRECQQAMARLEGATVNKQKLFQVCPQSDNRLFVKVDFTFESQQGDLIVTADGLMPPLLFADYFQLITFKTGHHSPEGIALVPNALVGTKMQREPMPLEHTPALLFACMSLHDVRPYADMEVNSAV